MSNMIVAPEVRDLGELAEKLVGWLGAQMPEAAQVGVDDLAYPFGAGMSHETILFDASWREDGRRREQGCVVRIKPTRQLMYPDDLFVEQYEVMRALHAGGWARVARPLWFEADPSLLGAPFFVMEKVRGRVAVTMPHYMDVGWVAEASPAERAKLWENGVRALASVQRAPPAELGFLAGPEGARDGLAQEWAKYERFVAWVSRDRRWPALEAGLDKLKASWPRNQPAGLVWGDARLGNLMFDEVFEVVAIMDWEQPSLGGALHDLAWWLIIDKLHTADSGRKPLKGMGTREDTIALWGELTGVSTADIEWYEAFTCLKLACLSIRMATLRGLPIPTDESLAARLGLRR